MNSQSAPHTRECVVLLRVVISGLLSLDARPTLFSVFTNNQGLATSFENIKQRLPVLFNAVTKFRDQLPAHVIVQVMWQPSDTPLAQLVDQLSEVGRMFSQSKGTHFLRFLAPHVPPILIDLRRFLFILRHWTRPFHNSLPIF